MGCTRKNAIDLANALYQEVNEKYKEKNARIAERTLPIFKQIHENRGETVKNIVVPFNDGKKAVNVLTPLEKNIESGGKQLITEFEKNISLAMIDDIWKQHLRQMDELKKEVQNASIEQKDPLLIYKFESFELFKKMIQKINKDVGSYLIKGDVYMKNNDGLREAKAPRGLDRSQMKEERGDMLSQSHSDTQEKQKPQPVKVEKRVGTIISRAVEDIGHTDLLGQPDICE